VLGAYFKTAPERPLDRAAGKGGKEVWLSAILGWDTALAASQPVAQFPDALRGADHAKVNFLGSGGGEIYWTVFHQTEPHVDVPTAGELEQRFSEVRQVK